MRVLSRANNQLQNLCCKSLRKTVGMTKAGASLNRESLLLKIRKVRQHSPRFSLDVLIFILRRQRGQRLTHAAVVLHRLQQRDRLGAHARIVVLQQRFQYGIAHLLIVFYIRPQTIEGLETHARVAIIAQSKDQSLPYTAVVGTFGEQIDRIEPDAGIDVAAGGEEKKLLDFGIVDRSLSLVGVNLVVLDLDLIAVGILSDAANAGDRCGVNWLLRV